MRNERQYRCGELSLSSLHEKHVTQTNKYIGQFLVSDLVYTILPCLNSSHPISTHGNSTSVPVPNQMELSP